MAVVEILDWPQYVTLVKHLGHLVKTRPPSTDIDNVVAVGRGGLIPGVCMSHFLNKPLNVMMVRSYKDETMSQAVFSINSTDIVGFEDIKGHAALVVDDIMEQGSTLQHVCSELQVRGATRCFTAVLVFKERQKNISVLNRPNWYAKSVHLDTWVVFPYEQEPKNK